MRLRRTIFCLLGVLIITTSHVVAADDFSSAKATVSQVLDKLLTEVKRLDKEGTVTDEAYLQLAESIIEHIDTETMARLAVGKQYWKQMTTTQRQSFLGGFRGMIISTYAKQATLLKGVRFEFLPPKPGQTKGKYVIVETQVHLEGKPPLAVGYALKQQQGAWKVFDFIVDGVSLVRQFRKNFDAEIRTTSLKQFIERISTFR